MKVCLKQVWKARKLDNTNLRGSITAWLISCLCYSDSAALLMLNQKQFYLLGQIQTRQTEDQPYCDTSPYGECSLIPGLRFLVKIRCLLATDQIFVFYLGCVMRRSIWASWRLWRQVGCDVAIWERFRDRGRFLPRPSDAGGGEAVVALLGGVVIVGEAHRRLDASPEI